MGAGASRAVSPDLHWLWRWWVCATLVLASSGTLTELRTCTAACWWGLCLCVRDGGGRSGEGCAALLLLSLLGHGQPLAAPLGSDFWGLSHTPWWGLDISGSCLGHWLGHREEAPQGPTGLGDQAPTKAETCG